MIMGEKLYVINQQRQVSALQVDGGYIDRHLELLDSVPARFDYTILSKYTFEMRFYPYHVEIDVPIGGPLRAEIGDYIVTDVESGGKMVLSAGAFQKISQEVE